MSKFFLKEGDFSEFISRMIEKKEVIGPVSQGPKFRFSKLNSPEELRLDYDITILPPKKVFFPAEQSLIKFSKSGYQSTLNPTEKILFGVHPYDIKGIDITDFLFAENKADINYLANREATTLVSSNIQSVSNRAFWDSVGTETPPKSQDAFITKLKDGYHFEVFTTKGEALLEFGSFEKATSKHDKEAETVNNMAGKCPERLKNSSEEISAKVRKSFKKNKMWEEMAEKCFSCGSCNTTCPTCYCFDVQDKWNVDQVSGSRKRYWDACLTEDFAKISLGAGAEENFRETRGSRFRHRIMRKASYLNDKIGTPACVGCGRCSSSCTADIADPVTIINKIMEASDV